MGDLEFEFTATVIEWRGPAPFYYAVVPREESAAIGTPPPLRLVRTSGGYSPP